jgi:uncharacterized protein
VSPRTDIFDLGGLSLTPGDGRRVELEVPLTPLEFGGQHYAADPQTVTVTLDVSCMVGGGYSLRLRFCGELRGPCMRCLEAAGARVDVDAREVDQPGGGAELESPYLSGQELDIAAWAHDAFALAAPTQVHCRSDCAGLCQICAVNLNTAGPGHHHEAEPDPRWAKLRELLE